MNVLSFCLILFLGIFSLSCHKVDEEAAFEAKLFVDLFASYEVTIPHPEYLLSVEPLHSPAATWQTLLRFKAPSESGHKDIFYCLNYQMPYEKMKIMGELQLEEANSNGLCLASGEGNSKLLKARLDQIKNFYFYLSAEKQLLKNEQKELQPFTLYLKFERKGEENWLTLPLYNLEKGRILKEDHSFVGHAFSKERYSSPQIERIFTGAQVLPLGKAGRVLSPSQALGKKTDSYAEEKIVRCHDLKPDCSEIKAYNCDECRYGWFEVSGSRCRGGYLKFCGIRQCGKKNEPACLRGTEFSQLSNLCFEGSNAGFCEEGLHTYCDSNGILICK